MYKKIRRKARYMVVVVYFITGEITTFAKVSNIALLSDGRLCLQRNDKRFKDSFREELIPIKDIKSFYSHNR
jgi:hypothetical protein